MKPEEIKLLIVEDNEVLRETIKDAFLIFKFAVTCAEDGQAAWDLLQKNNFDIVISDMRMPKMTGFELLKKVKEKDFNFPKFIAITGFTDYQIEDLYQAGVDGFFAKPFDVAEVKKCIKQSLVSTKERWSQNYIPANFFRVSKRFSNFEDAVKKQEILFGRLGFYLNLASQAPKVGEIIALDFSFGSPKPDLSMSGFGRVVYVQGKHGVGVEIIQINQEAIEKIDTYLSQQKIIASIPKAKGNSQ